jgi:opine dehydrogenase
MAADLTLKGYEVRLFELPQFADTLSPVIEAGGIALRGILGEGLAQPALVTTDAAAAIDGADVLVVVVPAQGHRAMAQACARHLEHGQVVVLTPGCFGGVLEFELVLHSLGVGADVTLAETTSLMYAAKKEGYNGVWARGLKQHLPLAAMPARRTGAVIDLLRPAFPQLVPAANVLDTSLNNANHIVHPAFVLMNLGLVEGPRFEDWRFFHDGFTPSTGRVGEQLDAERLALVRAFGLPEVGIVEWVQRYYRHQGMTAGSLYELFSTSPIHAPTRGPRSTASRLLTEDVPFGLVPLASLGRLAGVPMPTMEAVITLAGAVNGQDYRASGRTVASLGLEGMDIDEVIGRVTRGRAPA